MSISREMTAASKAVWDNAIMSEAFEALSGRPGHRHHCSRRHPGDMAADTMMLYRCRGCMDQAKVAYEATANVWVKLKVQESVAQERASAAVCVAERVDLAVPPAAGQHA